MSMIPDPATHTSVHWPPGSKLLFRFCCAYLILSCFPFPADYIPGAELVLRPVNHLLEAMATAMGHRWLHIQVPEAASPNGSGDTLISYLLVLLNLLLSAGIAVIWSIADHKRNAYPKLYYWTIVLARYYVADAMISYGCSKIFKTQFPYPSAARLVQPYGESSPMGLAWTFLGYSYGYNLFMGIAEISAGLLLLFRRTKTAGALLALVVTANIFAINLCFDVPVKIFSGHLLLLSFYILVPDLKRLYTAVLLQEAVPKAKERKPVYKRRTDLVLQLLKAVFLLIICHGIYEQYMYSKEEPSAVAKCLPNNCYQVCCFIRNRDTVSNCSNDPGRWEMINCIHSGYFHISTADKQRLSYYSEMDTANCIITLQSIANNSLYHLSIVQDSNHYYLLEGVLASDTVKAVMKPIRTDSMLLMSRGFHWVNEAPFNR